MASNCAYIFSYHSLDSTILAPIKSSQRIKYTCFDVSPSFLAFGSSSGGLYLFQKHRNNTYQFLLTIINDAGPISSLSFSSRDEQLLAIGTSRGHLIIVELDFDGDSDSEWKTIYNCDSFSSSSINILKWDDFRLYLTDEKGLIYVLHNIKSMSKMVVTPSPSTLLKVSTGIFQLDVQDHLILISSSSKFCLYNLYDATLTQIGTKPKSLGQYGLCFFQEGGLDDEYNDENSEQKTRIYATRRGSRLWEVDLNGNVLLTHQFKESLASQKQTIMINNEMQLKDASETQYKNLNATSGMDLNISLTFERLLVMRIDSDSFLVTHSYSPASGSYIFVIDPVKTCCIVAWTHFRSTQIHDMCCDGRDILVLHSGSSLKDSKMRFTKLSLFDYDQYLIQLCYNKQHIQAAYFISDNILYFKKRVISQNYSFISKVIKETWFKLNTKEKESHKEIEDLIEKDDSKDNDSANFSSESDNESKMSYKIALSETQLIDSPETESTQFSFNPVAQYLSYANGGFPDMGGLTMSKDVMDFGMNEFIKLRDNIKEKLANTGIRPTIMTTNHQIAAKKSSSAYGSSENLHQDHDKKLSLRREVKSSANLTNFDQESYKDVQLSRPQEDTIENLRDRLSSHDIQKCKCSCGFPLPESHLYQCETQKLLHKCINNNLKNGQEKHTIGDMLDICFETAIWPAYLQLLLECCEYEKYLKISLMLCDISLLDCKQVMSFMKDEKDRNRWQFLFNLFCKQIQDDDKPHSVVCIECEKVQNGIKSSITWESLFKLCVKTVDSQSTMEILQSNSHLIPKKALSTQFYLYLLRMQSMSAFQSPITKDKLAKLNDYLRISSTSDDHDHDDHNSFGMTIKLDRETCAVCHQVLATTFSGPKEQAKKVIIFSCGHYYHKSCQKLNHCHLCE